MTVARILSTKGRDVVTVAPHRILSEILRILNDKRIGAVVVGGADGEVLGIFSERDLVRALGRHGTEVLDEAVSRHMTSRVVTATEDMTVNQAMERMTEGRFRHIPVVEHGRLVGLVSIGDVVKYRIAEIEQERQDMLDYIGTA
ncbi:MAG TPA: CBS domain-containing protein [Lichenihabitans sp.]|jgi:CBS domain-containing protein|nr:CBS domain-containing protein [Lichenihabitans sp.]